MLDATPISHQRTRGTAHIRVGAGGVLEKLYQKGSGKIMLPRCHGPVPEAVFLNTAGGLTGGDRLDYRIDLAERTRLVATTQTAERAYASNVGAAEVTVTLSLGAGAHLDWLPQETILFDRSALHRTTRIELATGATCLFAEMLTLGRSAMGEAVQTLDLVDRRIVTRDGVPLFVDPLRLAGHDVLARAPASLGAASAIATVVAIAPDVADRLDALRQVLPDTAVASAWAGRLLVRAMAPDPYRLRCDVAAILKHLRGADLPRVWQY
ncbi:MAG: urease accessory protein UreD [Pseudomonadota bacterium]